MPNADRELPVDEEPATTSSLLAPFERDVLLATGRGVHVRAARPPDVERLRTFYAELDETSTYLRFFGFRPFIPEEELRRATVHDVGQQVTLVAESDGAIIGVGEYHARPGGEDAEVAFAVADAHHHEGVATVLLEDLALIARAAGFRRLVAETLPGNTAMQGVFRSVGLVHRNWFEDGIVHVELDLTADDLLQDHADLRDWQVGGAVAAVDRATRARRRDRRRPRRRSPGPADPRPPPRLVHRAGQRRRIRRPSRSAGRRRFRARRARRRTGSGRHRRARAVGGRRRRRVRRGRRAERRGRSRPGSPSSGRMGPGLQDELLAAARRHGMRIVGPNCLGVVSTACGLERHVHRPGVPARRHRHRIAVRRCRDRHRRRGPATPCRDLVVRVDGQQDRRQRQRPAAAVGRRRHDERRPAATSSRSATRSASPEWPAPCRSANRSSPSRAAGRRRAAWRDVAHRRAGDRPGRSSTPCFAHTGVMRARTLEELIDVGLLLDRQPPPAGRRVAADRQRRRSADPRRRRRRRRRPRRARAVAAAAGGDRPAGADRSVDRQPGRPRLRRHARPT